MAWRVRVNSDNGVLHWYLNLMWFCVSVFCELVFSRNVFSRIHMCFPFVQRP